MAYDEALTQRVRDHIGGSDAVVGKKMFGGIAFMNHGNMAVGISNDELMVRVGLDNFDEIVSEPGVREFDMTGKRMKGWILVDSQATGDDSDLHDWVDVGMSYAASLPPK